MNMIQNSRLFREKAYVAGKWISGEKTFSVRDPATGDALAQVADLGIVETRLAIDSAAQAWPEWRALTAKQRSVVLHKWHTLILDHVEDLAAILTAEQGKLLAEARAEILYGASFIEWFAEESKRVQGDFLQSVDPKTRLLVLKQPIGVCAAITPWNFPAAMITRKVAPALAAGCTVVVKPAEQTPLTALALAVLAEQAGFPPGVLNVVTGSAESAPKIGGELTANPLVRKLSFTGSTEVGRLLMAQCAPTVKKVSLELGGNAPFIVFDDANIEAAVEGAMASKYRNAGQTCVCANRLLVQSGIYEAFSTKLMEQVKTLQVGAGTESGVTQGPLIDTQALEKVEAHIADAVSKGARILTGGKRHIRGGSFFEPTVLADVTMEMRCAREEIFGPVAPIFRFENEADAIRLANATEYGLAGYFFSQNLGRIWRVAEALEYGMIGVNTGRISSEVGPFGGIKQSGIGREGSKYGIEEYLEIKYVCLAIE